jgi:rfaE bifunctional protein nucleotidyltransferase chain/domain
MGIFIQNLKEFLLKFQSIRKGKKVVFTNGCFDIIHAGHVHYLQECKKLGDILIVGINSDESIKKIKGDKRPIVPLEMRGFVLSQIQGVDYVIPFEEETPINLIKVIRPDILVKGGDWPVEKIVGKDFVEEYGGKVLTIPFRYKISTTQIIEEILKKYCS